MEKRLFLAVLLSLGIVFLFQWLFPTQTMKTASSNTAISHPLTAFKDQARLKNQGSLSADLPTETPSNLSVVDFPEEKLSIEQYGLLLEVSNQGGNIDHIKDMGLKHSFEEAQHFNIARFNQEQFRLKKIDDSQIQAFWNSPEWEVIKTYHIQQKNVLNVSVVIKNRLQTSQTFKDYLQAFQIDVSSLDKEEKKSDWTLREYVIQTDKKIIRKNNIQQLNEKWNKEEEVNIQWFGYRNKYFCSIVKPDDPLIKYTVQALNKNQLVLGAPIIYEAILPGQQIELKALVYVGPQTPTLLQSADKSFEKIFVFSDWGWLDAIAKGIYFILGFLHNLLPVWGLCIILISLLIYGIMYPLTLKSLTSMKKMQKLQPKIKKIQEQYKSNPEKLNQEIMQLYRSENVNPLSGCLPMLLQMPIFVGLYQVLWRSIYFRGESFLWIKDLSMPDRLIKLPVNIPFIGEYLNILPIVMMVVMALQQKISMASMSTDAEQAQQQKMMATIFPIMIGVIFYNFASGLTLYFVVFYILSAITQWKISRTL